MLFSSFRQPSSKNNIKQFKVFTALQPSENADFTSMEEEINNFCLDKTNVILKKSVRIKKDHIILICIVEYTIYKTFLQKVIEKANKKTGSWSFLHKPISFK